MIRHSTLFLLMYFNLCVAERITVPVFILDYGRALPHVQYEPNPFAKMTTSQFRSIIDEVKGKSRVVLIFIEQSLCLEDISSKDKLGSPFFHLSQGIRDRTVKFLPSVIHPFKTLTEKFPKFEQNVYHVSGASSKIKIYDGRYEHLYIYFKDDPNQSRSNALRTHDLIIKELFFIIRQIVKGPLVAIYTGKHNPIIIEKLDFIAIHPKPIPKEPGVTIVSYGAMFRFMGVFTSAGTRRSSFSQIPEVTDETWTPNKLTTRMSYTDFELEFSFLLRDRDWIVDDVALLEWGEEVGRTKIDGGAPWKSSYVCGEALVLVNTRDASSVTITHYQLQPFQDNFFLRSAGNTTGNASAGNDTCFGSAVNCAPYFTAQILAGLVITFLCLGILFYGVIFMYNCHSNDRYDDQHAKALVIVADSS